MEAFGNILKTLLISGAIFYLLFIFHFNQNSSLCVDSNFITPLIKNSAIFSRAQNGPSFTHPPTNLSHLVFGLVGSEKAWHHRKPYIESWWRPNITRGFIFLDKPPSPKLLPWPQSSPSYRVSDDLTPFLNKRGKEITAHRIVNGIMETFREDHENLRWLVMGDDDSIFFLDNMISILSKYDHTKYYYFGGRSEFILSNFWFSFNQGFGGAGFILSYALAKALVDDMKSCLWRYRHLKDSADLNTMYCIADIGANLINLDGIHQIDLRGDISGFLSSHPKSPLISLHHFDMVSPIFPSMNRVDSTNHLMNAARFDQSRMLQQTVCHHRPTNWTLSISWGYSAHIYESVLPRSYLQMPIETFRSWNTNPKPPRFMFNTRAPTTDPCWAPHWFYYDTIIEEEEGGVVTTTVFRRAWPRGIGTCLPNGNHTADYVAKIRVLSSATKRLEMDRSECCDVVRIEGDVAEVKYRECLSGEIIA